MPGCVRHCQKMNNKPSTFNNPRSLQIKATFIVRSSLHPCPGNWVAIGRAVVYNRGLPPHLAHELHVGTVSYIKG